MGKPMRDLSRKQRRKKERRMKKAKKCTMYLQRHMKVGKLNELMQKECKELNEDKTAIEDEKKSLKTKKQKPQKQKKQTSIKDIRKQQLKEDNKREDKNIRMLEKKMKLNRRKNNKLPKSFIDDGLSYILEACDSEIAKNLDPEKEFLEKDDFEMDQVESEDKDLKKNTKLNEGTKKVRWKDEIEDEETDIEMDEDDEMNEESEESFEMNENGNESDEDLENLNISQDENDEEKSEGEFWEDIYGRKRDKEGKVIQSQPESQGKYIPPSKRNENSDQLLKLKKQLKGLLNRLSEGNMKTIASQIEDLYLINSRNDMNQTLENLIYSSIVQHTLTPERLVQEHVMLITLLHADIGSEVGAHFLQSLVVKFNELHKNEIQDENKEIHNILLLLANLYNFKVVHSLLMIDLLQLLAERFNSFDLELILLLLRNVGFVLRKDDPTSLKEVVLTLQSKAQESSQSENESRVKFMLETLMAIKNNNMTKIPNYDPTHLDHLRKLLRGFIRKGCFVVELRISFNDLLNAETKGRWWIVGSSWSGEQSASSDTKKINDVSTAPMKVNEKIMELARKQRMNTDIRRNIFYIIMTADDYVDCFEKLMKLGLQSQQEREVIHVIINCCMNETKFNQYYVHLASKFCDCDRKYQMAFQYAFWDRFKELDNTKKIQASNLADFVAFLLTTRHLSMSILKVIHFSEMNKNLVRFLRQLLLRVLLHNDFKEIFKKINPTPKLRMFREGLRLFLRHFILRQKEKLELNTNDELDERINQVEKILLTAESSILL